MSHKIQKTKQHSLHHAHNKSTTHKSATLRPRYADRLQKQNLKSAFSHFKL